MRRRPFLFPASVLLVACVALIPACRKKGGGEPVSPEKLTSGYVVFAHMKSKDILQSELFADVKKAFEKEGVNAWEQAEQEFAKELGGLKPTDFDSVTACLTETPNGPGMPKMIVIAVANKAIDKKAVKFAAKQPDQQGFYREGSAGALIHFPDEKTIVFLHPELADKYLGGYAKDRSGWPMTSELKDAAAGHTLFAVVDLSKLPTQALGGAGEQFAPLLKAKALTITADFKGKEIIASVRASFPDAAAAEKAKETVKELIGMASGFIDQFASSKQFAELGELKPAVTEAQRALKEIKIEVSGSDLVVAGSYKVNFNLGAALVTSVQKVREAAARMTESNNLKQIGLALHNYHDSMGRAVIHGTGPKGAPLAKPTDKPLLSWRVAILPYIEQDNLYKQFNLDEPWDSEHNKKLIPMMPKIYAPVAKPGKPGETHLQMVIGPNAMQPPSVQIGAIRDGTSNTIAVVQAADPVIWTKPDDVMLPGKDLPKDLKKKFGGQFRGGFNVVMWDGSVRFVPDTISDRTLGIVLNPNDGQVIPSDW